MFEIHIIRVAAREIGFSTTFSQILQEGASGSAYTAFLSLQTKMSPKIFKIIFFKISKT